MNSLRMLFVSMLTLSILVACSQDDTKDTVKEDETQTTNEVEHKSKSEDTADKTRTLKNRATKTKSLKQ